MNNKQRSHPNERSPAKTFRIDEQLFMGIGGHFEVARFPKSTMNYPNFLSLRHVGKGEL